MRKNVAFVLDSSGSMGPLKQAAINGFNENIQSLRVDASGGHDIRVWLLVFNDNVLLCGSKMEPKSVADMTLESYQPSGSTALQDAMGDAIQHLRDETMREPESAYLVVTVTDGEENASKRLGGQNGLAQLRSLIDECQKSGRWTFVFSGTPGLDAFATALSIPKGNQQVFHATANAYKIASATRGSGLKHYMSAVDDAEINNAPVMSANFFAQPPQPNPANQHDPVNPFKTKDA